MKTLLTSIITLLISATFAQAPLITDLPSRKTISLNGKWQYIMDPYETGFYDYRFRERRIEDQDAYWTTDIPKNKSDKKEHGYTDKYTLMVPGDWNHQDPKFLYYEGTVWYKKSFDFPKQQHTGKVFLNFGAVNYKADVYLNGKKLGSHKGGFTPFNFEIPDTLLKAKDNYLVLKVDNKRFSDEVPTINTDWWNYGGITRDVKLIELPSNYIHDYFIHLTSTTDKKVEGWVKLSEPQTTGKVEIKIPELNISNKMEISGDSVPFSFSAPNLKLWSPEHPKLYKVIVTASSDEVTENIGFRTIAVSGKQILLNGQPIFMRGISIHGEIASEMRRAHSHADALKLLLAAKELGCNMVRLAHYPHDESMTRTADSLGILVWSEIPVYWTIEFGNPKVFDKAKQQLNEMISRDKNRSSIIIWSVGNETPVSAVRTDFMHKLIVEAKQLDPSRLVSAALEVNYNSGNHINKINDPLGEFVDLVAFNEYLGWYGGSPAACRTTSWTTDYNKPLFISEIGAEALSGYHADSLTRWSEEYQKWYYDEQIAMLKKMPDNFVGISPWVLFDFRSPKRNNPRFQDGWNNKGLIGHNGAKKKAYFSLKNYYLKITATGSFK